MAVTLPARWFKPNVGILLIIHPGPNGQVDKDSLVLQGIPGTSIHFGLKSKTLENSKKRTKLLTQGGGLAKGMPN